jgi:hypothetical protein
MPKIPDPKTLRKKELAAKRYISDREWKKYRRYLVKFNNGGGKNCDEEPLSFEEFCIWLYKKEFGSLDIKNPLSNS